MPVTENYKGFQDTGAMILSYPKGLVLAFTGFPSGHRVPFAPMEVECRL